MPTPKKITIDETKLNSEIMRIAGGRIALAAGALAVGSFLLGALIF